MPEYDYRCKSCRSEFTLFYKTYADFDAAAPVCPHCGSVEMSRLIRRVTIARPGRDLSKLSAQQMMSVLDGGDSREIGQLFDQVGQTAGVENMSETYRETTDKLLSGESVEKVEKGLQEQATASPPPQAEPKSPPKKASS
ncbi:MAG: zinc ribbon domain-containing protein [Anaerolineaceae bacterium]|nr:zinc ribbon domain-containing protein [Anaerolineaceae bacterium]